MRSSTGAYFVGLDHLRALAALLVFEWHFIHTDELVPLEVAPNFFPAAIFDEGHCGVALFMCLSGYLFAKLLDGKAVYYWGFLWNRFIRLAPLLFLVIVIVGLRDNLGINLFDYFKGILKGAVYPVLPNGGWSLTAEAHFYVVLPLILVLLKRRVEYVVLIALAAVLLRTGLYLVRGEVQSLAYWTIIGRIDQFTLGMVAFALRAHLTSRHKLMFAAFMGFAAFYWWFAATGGFFNSPSYPSPSPIWIVIPTIEAAFFSALIAYYDTSLRLPERGLSALVAKIGAYSYSIYLMHFFYVFWLSRTFASLTGTHNFYLAAVGGFVCFLAAAALASITYRLVELPFLKFRVRYVRLPERRAIRPDRPQLTSKPNWSR